MLHVQVPLGAPSFEATCLSLVQTSIRADSPSGKTPQGERCENMLACFHIRAEDVSASNPQPVFPAYLAVESFEDVVCPDVALVLAEEVEIRQRFAHALAAFSSSIALSVSSTVPRMSVFRSSLSPASSILIIFLSIG